jgi:NAD+ synthase (glutamine-hydrolysing)
MGTENSSPETLNRAQKIAEIINSNHRAIKFDAINKEFQKLAEHTYSFSPKFKNEGGSWNQDLALQNIQARTRMVLSYFMAQL